MSQKFIHGDEILNKKDFDEKVNIDEPLNLAIVNDPTKDDLYSAHNVLQIGRDVTNTGTNNLLLNDWDNFLLFGYGDVKNIIDFGTDTHKVKVTTISAQGIAYSEQLAFESEIKALQDRVSALEKQIGGGAK